MQSSKVQLRTNGVSRTVLLVGRYAVKVPSFRHGWSHFLLGWLGNVLEWQRWRATKHPRLAPVYCSLLAGLVNVQRRYYQVLDRRLTNEELKALPFINIDNNGENVAADGGELTLIDYGNTQWYLLTWQPEE